MKKIKINNKIISREGPVFVIAEIGINHNGSLKIAKKLIDIAVECGVDAVKFQKRDVEVCIPDNQRNVLRETPWGTMTYFNYKKRLEFGKKEYCSIDKYCKKKGIIWFASPWDIQSVDFLKKFKIPCYKIASAQLTNKDLLLKIRSLNKPIFLSTGMSTEKEISAAVKLLGTKHLILLHCNSAYPAEDPDLNLSYIKVLLKKYPNVVVGYSGHERGIAASIVSVALGARVIEKHITLDRSMWGTDQAASIEFDGIRRLTRDVKKVSVWIGKPIKKVTSEEQIIKSKLRKIDNLLSK